MHKNGQLLEVKAFANLDDISKSNCLRYVCTKEHLLNTNINFIQLI